MSSARCCCGPKFLDVGYYLVNLENTFGTVVEDPTMEYTDGATNASVVGRWILLENASSQVVERNSVVCYWTSRVGLVDFTSVELSIFGYEGQANQHTQGSPQVYHIRGIRPQYNPPGGIPFGGVTEPNLTYATQVIWDQSAEAWEQAIPPVGAVERKTPNIAAIVNEIQATPGFTLGTDTIAVLITVDTPIESTSVPQKQRFTFDPDWLLRRVYYAL